MGKIFCIGFQKTGTTSLGKALESLGYSHTSYNAEIKTAYSAGEKFKLLLYMSNFESADDAPWNKVDMIPLLDRVFPHSRFIYSFREEDSWQRSVINWSMKMTGSEPNIDGYLNDYREHRAFVDRYFVGKNAEMLLRINVGHSGAFNQLKGFLGFPLGEDEFPHHNQTALL